MNNVAESNDKIMKKILNTQLSSFHILGKTHKI